MGVEIPDLADDPRSGTVALPPLVWTAIAICFVCLALLAFTHSVNWDEFFYLSRIYAYQAGGLNAPPQNFHVRLFGFLTGLPGDEMNQIAIARLLMLAFLALSSVAIYRIAHLFVSPEAALVGVLAFLTSGFVLGHGGSFRTDPIAAGLLMVGLAVLMASPLRPLQMALAAVCCAVAVLVTIKAVLYLPAFLAALLWRTGDWEAIWRVVLSGIAAIVLAGGLYLWHSSTFAPEVVEVDARMLAGSAEKTLLSAGFWPRRWHTLTWAILSIGPILLIGAGLLAPAKPRRRLVLVLLMLPLASVLFYRNAFPYFFPFIVPPVMVVAAVGAERLSCNARRAAMILLLASGVFQSGIALREDARAQHATLQEVHRLFQEPVTYIDRNGMVSSFPKVGFFMSSWGLETYRERGEPVFERQLDEHAPPLLLANSPALALALEDRPGPLFEDDAEVLRESYVHHWGPIWLAGTKLPPGGGEIFVRVPGRYRLDGTGGIVLNGRAISPTDVVTLGTGAHQVSAAGQRGSVLVWDTGVSAPDEAFTKKPVYYGFWSPW